jgi:hypothetical protein
LITRTSSCWWFWCKVFCRTPLTACWVCCCCACS